MKLTGCGSIYSALRAKKFNVLYRLCEEQLSKQPHYDFGLRNILAVLRTAGASRRAAADLSERGELLLMMRTLRDMNLSKFMAEDVPLFLALIDDLFPGERAEKAQHPRVESEIAKVIITLIMSRIIALFICLNITLIIKITLTLALYRSRSQSCS